MRRRLQPLDASIVVDLSIAVDEAVELLDAPSVEVSIFRGRWTPRPKARERSAYRREGGFRRRLDSREDARLFAEWARRRIREGTLTVAEFFAEGDHWKS